MPPLWLITHWSITHISNDVAVVSSPDLEALSHQLKVCLLKDFRVNCMEIFFHQNSTAVHSCEGETIHIYAGKAQETMKFFK